MKTPIKTETKFPHFLEAFLTWCDTTQARFVGALFLALFNLFSTTKLATFILSAIWFLTVLGFKKVNMRRWLLLICSIVLAVLLTSIWPFIENEIKASNQKKAGEQTKERIQTLFIPIFQPTQQSFEMTSIDADKNKSELIVTLKNFGRTDILLDNTVWIGVFPFFGSYQGDQIKWIRSNDKQDIPSGMIGQFRIKHPVEPHMAIVVAIVGKEFPKGLLLDEFGILYTWDYWQYNGWTTWQDHKNSVTQTGKMEMVLDKFKRCAYNHSIDRNYTPCFENKVE